MVTAVIALLLSLLVFAGVLIFLLNAWVTDLHQRSQNAFIEREKRLDEIQTWTLNYTNDLYGNVMLIKDVKTLFRARSMAEYIRDRRKDSLGSNLQIGYFPANVKKLFLDGRSRIAGITLRSESGMKAVWLEAGDAKLSFGVSKQADIASIGGFGDIMAASYPIRDPEHMDQTLGSMDFWIDSGELYGEDVIDAAWGLLGEEGGLLTFGGFDMRPEEAGVPVRQLEWLKEASGRPELSGWFWGKGGGPVFFMKQVSGMGAFSFVAVKN